VEGACTAASAEEARGPGSQDRENVCRDYARWSADDLRRMMADRRGLAEGGEQIKLAEEQMTSAPNAGSASSSPEM
jgi:hypothetical protein